MQDKKYQCGKGIYCDEQEQEIEQEQEKGREEEEPPILQTYLYKWKDKTDTITADDVNPQFNDNQYPHKLDNGNQNEIILKSDSSLWMNDLSKDYPITI
eukprot:gene3574-6181_t